MQLNNLQTMENSVEPTNENRESKEIKRGIEIPLLIKNLPLATRRSPISTFHFTSHNAIEPIPYQTVLN